MPTKEPKQNPNGSWFVGPSIRDVIAEVLFKALPILFKSMAGRFGILESEAEEFFGNRIELEIGETSTGGANAELQVYTDSDVARVVISANPETSVADWSPARLASTLELEHFFQETLVYERDVARHQEEGERPWIDRTHEQGAIIEEIRMAKERGLSKEDFKAQWKGAPDHAWRMEVVDHLWDLEDDVEPQSVVGDNAAVVELAASLRRAAALAVTALGEHWEQEPDEEPDEQHNHKNERPTLDMPVDEQVG